MFSFATHSAAENKTISYRNSRAKVKTCGDIRCALFFFPAGLFLISSDYIHLSEWIGYTIFLLRLVSCKTCLQNIIGLLQVYIAIEKRPHEIRTKQNEYFN